MKDIERSDLISSRYFSEIDEALVSALNLCPSFVIGAFMVLCSSGAVAHDFNVKQWILSGAADALVVHGLIFHFICNDVQQTILRWFMEGAIMPPHGSPLLSDFFSNP